jgi:hypothetical protein
MNEQSDDSEQENNVNRRAHIATSRPRDRSLRNIDQNEFNFPRPALVLFAQPDVERQTAEEEWN